MYDMTNLNAHEAMLALSIEYPMPDIKYGNRNASNILKIASQIRPSSRTKFSHLYAFRATE
jgi:hypothetical protein